MAHDEHPESSHRRQRRQPRALNKGHEDPPDPSSKRSARRDAGRMAAQARREWAQALFPVSGSEGEPDLDSPRGTEGPSFAQQHTGKKSKPTDRGNDR